MSDAKEGVRYAPWERTLERLLTPLEEFIHRQTTSGLLLMATAVLALVLANSALAGAYHSLTHLPVGIRAGDWELDMTLHHWVNDGLMAFFFFLVGMELKREILVGELANFRQAALPVFAALGGMIVPAAIYVTLNATGDGLRGWGIPMATDIAFAAGVLVILAARVPRALLTFLVALAIVDDLGAVLVIAVFYTRELSFAWLSAAAGALGILMLFNLAGIRKVAPYFLMAVLLWYALLQSGVHATLAGVLGALTVPVLPRYDPALFSRRMKALLARFDDSNRHDSNIVTNDALRAVVQTIENGAVSVQAPLQRLEHFWHLPVAFVVIPVFAFINAGIALEPETLGATFSHPVTLGVVAGLVIGKFVGITGASALALRLGVAQLPTATRFAHIAAVSLLAGIGFTMSIFIAELGFADNGEHLRMAKTGVLAASLLSGALGFVWLMHLGRDAGRDTART